MSLINQLRSSTIIFSRWTIKVKQPSSDICAALGHQHLVAGGTESPGTSVRRFSSPRPTFPSVLVGGRKHCYAAPGESGVKGFET
jgi:hypothetical protein